jgi:ABC-type glycerol-3-phosphate transport system substrate-binding protein
MAPGYSAPVAIRRTAFLLAALALLVGGLMLSSCGGEGDSAATTETSETTTETMTESTTTEATTTEPAVEQPTVVRVAVVNGSPKDGIVRKTVDKGDRVVLVVTSDVADEVHLHGYDISRDVVAGGTARIAFEATLPGRFEVELEDRGIQIADLTVQP